MFSPPRNRRLGVLTAIVGEAQIIKISPLHPVSSFCNTHANEDSSPSITVNCSLVRLPHPHMTR